MAFNQNRRLSKAALQADQDALLAIRKLHDYQSVNPDYALEALNRLDSELKQAYETEKAIENMLKAARNATINTSWDLHNAILGARKQVSAQYGPNSNAVVSVGLKRQSERKRPSKRNGGSEKPF